MKKPNETKEEDEEMSRIGPRVVENERMKGEKLVYGCRM